MSGEVCDVRLPQSSLRGELIKKLVTALHIFIANVSYECLEVSLRSSASANGLQVPSKQMTADLSRERCIAMLIFRARQQLY